MEELKTYSCVILSDIRGEYTLMLPSQTFTKSIKMPDRTKSNPGLCHGRRSTFDDRRLPDIFRSGRKGKWHDTAVQEVLR